MNTCRAVSKSSLQGVYLATLSFILLLTGTLVFAQSNGADWQRQARENVRGHQLGAALEIVERRPAQDDTDLEARGWHARLLAWTGRWAEQEYRRVLDQFSKYGHLDRPGGCARLAAFVLAPFHRSSS